MIETTFLTAVPFPLLAPSSQLLEPHEKPKVQEESPLNTISSSLRIFESYKESLVDLEEIPEKPCNAREIFAQDYNLNRVIKNLYHSAPKHDFLLKMAALSKILEKLDLPNTRISRQTAAWVWGYLPPEDTIHLDFEKKRRVSSSRMRKQSISPHQLNEFAQHEVTRFLDLEITTPLRTVLDLLQYEESKLVTEALQAFLSDPEQGTDLKTLYSIICQQKHLQNREKCLETLMLLHKGISQSI